MDTDNEKMTFDRVIAHKTPCKINITGKINTSPTISNDFESRSDKPNI